MCADEEGEKETADEYDIRRLGSREEEVEVEKDKEGRKERKKDETADLRRFAPVGKERRKPPMNTMYAD